jgi:hypothetical protein
VKFRYALVGLAALGGAALSAGTASAMPIGLATNTDLASNVEQVRLVCDVYGRCVRTGGYYGYGYGGPPLLWRLRVSRRMASRLARSPLVIRDIGGFRAPFSFVTLACATC